MSSLAHSLVTWEEFLHLSDRSEQGTRYELHDGKVVILPPARPLHIKVQKRIEKLFEAAARDRGVVAIEFPYRPLRNLQYWVADVAYIPKADWDDLPPDEYPVYAPQIVVEVLSPSNTDAKLNRQMIVAISAGAQEFWVVDPTERTVRVTAASKTIVYRPGDSIPVLGTTIDVDAIFTI